MKMKLLLFLALLVGSVSLSFVVAPSAYAVGESYRWIDEKTIEGSKGSYTQTTGVVKDGPSGPSRPVPVQTVRFTRDGNTKVFRAPTTGIYYGSISGGSGFSTKCDLQLSITVSALNAGSISTNDPERQECPRTGLTKALTIANPENGPTAESLGVQENTTTGPGASLEEEEPASTCKIDGIGWIICPVVRTLAGMVDGAYAFVSSLLIVQPLIADDSDASKSIYGAWSVMRNFANIAFILAFIIIVYSQLTSMGISNYGIKKMLPRLIVAAILVNTSFWICALAVDISNILGASLNGLFQSLPVDGQQNERSFNYDDGQTGAGWAGIAGGVLAATAITAGVLYATLSALLPALLAAFVAIVTVFIVLTLRQALIILLIVISPLAFVAYLLPNTESLFKKWLGLFKTLLLMFPIIAVIFGASALASEIVMSSATGDYAVAIQIMGALVAIIPLALTPVVMKTAGGLLNRFGGIINNPNKGPVDKLRKKSEAYRDRRQAIAGGRRIKRGQWALDKTGGLQNKIRGDGSSRFRSRTAATLGSTAAGVASSGATSQYDAQQKNENAKRGLTENQQDYVANRAAGDITYAKSIAGPTGSASSLQSSALTAVQNRKLQEIKDEHAFIDTMGVPELEAIIMNTNNVHSEEKVSAAIETFVKQANTNQIESVVNKYATNGDEKSIINQTLSKTLAQDGPQFLKGSDFSNIARGQLGKNGNPATLHDLAAKNIRDGVYAQEKLVVAPKDELQYSLNVAIADGVASGDTKARDMLRVRAQELIANPTLNGKIKHNVVEINTLAS